LDIRHRLSYRRGVVGRKGEKGEKSGKGKIISDFGFRIADLKKHGAWSIGKRGERDKKKAGSSAQL
jgi:hypothetical protein